MQLGLCSDSAAQQVALPSVSCTRSSLQQHRCHASLTPIDRLLGMGARQTQVMHAAV